MSNWTLFSNHGHVLVCLARDSDARLRDVAADVGITERAVQKIVRDLQDSGMISVSKHGRRNRYIIHRSVTLRHELESHCTLGGLIGFLNTEAEMRRHAKQSGFEMAKSEKTDPVFPKPQERLPETSGPETLGPEIAAPEEHRPKESRPKDVIERQQGSLF